MASTTVSLAGGAVHALQNTYALDGRMSTFPTSVRGVAPTNVYLLPDGDRGLLLDAGFTAHGDALLRQLGTLVSPSTVLSIFPLRLGEFDSVCNVPAIARRFQVDLVYGGQRDGVPWLDFLPRADGEPADADALAHLRFEFVGAEGTIRVDGDGGRSLIAFRPLLRLLVTHWVYDPASRTLFTSDVFTHAWRRSERDRFVVTAGDDDFDVEDVRRHLLQTRYWWVRGADTEPLRRDLAGIFERYEIDRIAPAYGCVLDGPDVVARHHDLLQQVLVSEGGRR